MGSETKVCYIKVLETNKVYVLDESKCIQYVGTASDAILSSVPQLHDDDSETSTWMVTVNGKSNPCYASRQFATEKEFTEWKRV